MVCWSQVYSICIGYFVWSLWVPIVLVLVLALVLVLVLVVGMSANISRTFPVFEICQEFIGILNNLLRIANDARESMGSRNIVQGYLRIRQNPK